jgi:glycerol-3-phosphate acyltransferase PlsY
MIVPLFIAAVVGYLLGSLPFGYLVARAMGVNIFEVGSKSPGATNVRRVLGSGPGNLVLFLDLLKGALAVFFATMLAPFDVDWYLFGLVGLLAALVGHAFSCFTKFRGGKGVATAAGGFILLFPVGVLVADVVWGLTIAGTRYVSLASILAGVALTATAWRLHQPPLILGASALVMVFIIVRHRANISRLLAGTESKVGQKPEQPKP